MVPNYEYVLSRAAHAKATQILDFGCGGGEVVCAALERGLNAYGVDAYFGHSHGSYERARASGMFGIRLYAMESETSVPFPDATFDFVISNQVFEHVRDLPIVLAEIRRVMKPEGVLLALFPTRDVLREGHFGIPLVHLMPRNRLRWIYTLAMRRMGFGKHTSTLSRSAWVNFWLDWLDQFTFYRPHQEVNALLVRHFDVKYVEDDWIAFRLEHRGMSWAKPVFIRPLSRLIARRLGGTIVEARAR